MSTRGKLKLAVLISGRGSNMAAIARACRQGDLAARIVTVISDRSEAAGIGAASALGLATAVIEARTYPDRALFEAALVAAIDAGGAELVALAGFMRILSAGFVQRYAGRLLNIHPSLLPRYKGLHTHRQAIAADEREHGASVHFVTDELDGGPVLWQARVPVHADDSEQTLAARVLLQEHRIYPLAIGLIAAGRVKLDGATIMLDGQVLNAPLIEEQRHA
jgi:phosphoribosylglycinamide formyltransferase 1